MAGQSSSIKLNEASSKEFIDGIWDVENTTNERNDTFINIIELEQPDPAIVALKNKKESKKHRLAWSGRW